MITIVLLNYYILLGLYGIGFGSNGGLPPGGTCTRYALTEPAAARLEIRDSEINEKLLQPPPINRPIINRNGTCVQICSEKQD